DQRNAGLMLYGLQIASSNLSQMPFEPPPEEVVRSARGLPPEREIRRHQRRLREAQSSQTPLSSAGAEYVVPREQTNPAPPDAESGFSP
ncbi:MAG TPA: hypothetical protein VEW69_12135, partial [Alphaproteobacteria bacterium]|nr:hypothetical protein [Alphaproteobacteria bacterium]